MKYINAEKLIAEIRIIQSSLEHRNVRFNEVKKTQTECMIEFCKSILEVINSLQQEQPKVDLEKEIKYYFMDSCYNLSSYECYEIASHFYILGLNARKEVDIVPLQEEKMVCYINYCLQREDDDCNCPNCGEHVTGLRLFPYYYDRENNDVYFASVCPECGKIIISKE